MDNQTDKKETKPITLADSLNLTRRKKRRLSGW
jgi:hypothetical protein